MDNQSHSILMRVVFPLLGLTLAVIPASINPVATAQNITYENFDVEGFWDIYHQETPFEDVTTEDILQFERTLEDAIRRAETQEIADKLKAAAERWHSLSKQHDEELKAVARQAQRDAKVRSVARFFRLVAATAAVVDSFASRPTGPSDATAPVTIDDISSPEGSVQVRETYERTVRVRMNDKWQTISVDKILSQHLASPLDTKSPVTRHLLDRLGHWADELPPLACNAEWGGCSAISSYDAPAYTVTPVADTLKREPSSEEKGVFDRIRRFGVDLTPVGDIYALGTGRNLLTGQQASRGNAAVGIVVGSVGGPLAKGALKSAKGLWKLGPHKSISKWIKQFTKRGWTPDKVDEAILKGSKYKVTNNVNPKNGATRFEHQGKSVVKDDATEEILHVGEEGFKY